MVVAYIGLGANLKQPLQQVESAIHHIKQLPESCFTACSPWYGSSAVGPGDQPDYINGACSIETSLAALDLLAALQEIENQQHRERTTRWGARTLDLDILIYGDTINNSAELTLPHPRLTERNFVLLPLADIAPQLTLPNGQQVAQLASQCSRDGIWIHS